VLENTATCAPEHHTCVGLVIGSRFIEELELSIGRDDGDLAEVSVKWKMGKD
jgi:hypothetical protein